MGTVFSELFHTDNSLPVNMEVLLAQSCQTLCDPMDCSRQSPLFIGFSRQEYWSRLPCPPPGDIPDPGIEPRSLTLQADSLLFELLGKQCTFVKAIPVP